MILQVGMDVGIAIKGSGLWRHVGFRVEGLGLGFGVVEKGLGGQRAIATADGLLGIRKWQVIRKS